MEPLNNQHSKVFDAVFKSIRGVVDEFEKDSAKAALSALPCYIYIATASLMQTALAQPHCLPPDEAFNLVLQSVQIGFEEAGIETEAQGIYVRKDKEDGSERD